MVNSYFKYPHIELWQTEKWTDKISQVFGLVKWMGANEPYEKTVHPMEAEHGDGKKLPCYDNKPNAVNLPETIQYWRDRGVHYECRAQGGLSWLIMAPVSCLDDFGKKLQSVFVMHRTDLSDPWWAMKTLEKFKAYNEKVAQDQDTIVVYICTNGPDTNRIYVNILQEAYVVVPGDSKRIYLDVSPVYNTGHTLKDVEDFRYTDASGNPADPDAAVFEWAGGKLLDVSGRWENRTSLSRDQVAGGNWSNTQYDLERVIHSETGAAMARGFAIEYDYDTTYEPEFIQLWKDMGILYENRETRKRRWKAAVPRAAMEHPEVKLPVIAVMQEVNSANEHLAVTETSYFYEYFRLCAQGECILVNFVLEDFEGNDILDDILKEAFQLYPCDQSRVYIAGHSHNGFYALEYAIRHPKQIAAVATYGDPPGHVTTGNLPVKGERLEKMKAMDMPLINLSGMTEHTCMYPISGQPEYFRTPPKTGTPHPVSLEERVASWQRRLDAFKCPQVTEEEILATRESKNKAVRMTGIPSDKAQTIWMDGFELYIVDVKNHQGRYWLRMVAEENMPHNTTPNQQKISWDFLRRFARDLETGAVIELYE